MIGVTAVVVTGVVVGVGALIASQPDASPRQVAASTLTWVEGACVRRLGTTVELATCDRASGRVSRIAAAPPRCPADTDEFVSLGPGRTACVRNAREPHPGDPGNGGGILRAGDCIAFAGGERACAAKDWYGRVTGVASSRRQCPQGTADTLKLRGGSVVCLGKGGQVIATGDCVQRPALQTSARRIVKVRCSSPKAWAKITGRVLSADDCPGDSDHYLRFRGASGVICLRGVRPTRPGP
jgi:hypothetical protein